MTTQPQLGEITKPSCFRTGYNAGTAIAAGYILKHDGTNRDGVALASASTDALAGVSTEAIEASTHRSYQNKGRVMVYAGDTVTAGQKVVADATGRAVAASSPSASTFVNYLGTAITGGAVGEWILVELEIGSQCFVGLSSVATKAALTAIAAANRANGQLVLVQADNSLWRFNSASTATADTAAELVLTPDAGSGRWIRADKAFVMRIPIAYTNTDAQAVETIPAGFVLRLAGMPFWDITTGFTGGSSSTIGISTSLTGYTTKGDLLGGASGDAAATLVAGVIPGTLGGELDDHVGFQALALVASSEIRFDRITSAFTAGAGFACIPVVQCQPAA